MQNPTVITLGHESAEVSRLFEALTFSQSKFVLDIRARPANRHLGEWDARKLKKRLAAMGIGYHWLGTSLDRLPEWQQLVNRSGAQIPDSLLPADLASRISKWKSLVQGQNCVVLGVAAEAYGCPRFYRLAPILQLWGSKVMHLQSNGHLIENWKLELELAAEYLPLQSERGFPLGIIYAYQAHRNRLEAGRKDEPPDGIEPSYLRRKIKMMSFRHIWWSLAGA